MDTRVQLEIDFQQYFGDLFDDKGNKVEPSSIINWVQDQIRKMDFNTRVIVVGKPAELNMEIIRESLKRGNFGLDIRMGDDVGVPERGIKISRLGDGGLAAQVNKLCEDRLAEKKEEVYTLTNHYHDIQMPFVEKDTKPHPTNWRQSNRHYKRKR